MSNRILIIGSSGLVGTALMLKLSASGVELVRFGIQGRGRDYGNVRNRDQLRAALASVNGISHLATISCVIWGERDPELCWSTNVDGLKNVLELTFNRPLRPWVIFASSRDVYGEPDTTPAAEDYSIRPVKLYGRSKSEGERLVADAPHASSRVGLIRLSKVFGFIADHAERVVPAFARAAAFGQELRVDGADHTFNFTHIDDVAHGVVTLAGLLAAGGDAPPPIHLVSGTSTTLDELANLSIRKGQSGAAIRTAAPRGFDVARCFGSPSRAKDPIGWQPLIKHDEGVTRLINGFRSAARSSALPEAAQ